MSPPFSILMENGDTYPINFSRNIYANTKIIILFSLKGKDGAVYKKHGGFCLETQKFPNSINQANFPNSVVRPGDVYKHTVVYKLGKN